MALIGGDAPALFNFAAQLRERRRNIERAAHRLGLLVQEADWVGPDRERFVAQWQERHAPNLENVCQNLDTAATRASNAASAQQAASEGGGGGGGW